MAESVLVEELTPLDLVMPGTYVQALLTFPTSGPAMSVEHLQHGLDCLSDRHPWLCGYVIEGQMRMQPSDLPPILADHGIIKPSYDTLAAQGMPPASIPPEVWPMTDAPEVSTARGAPIFAASVFQFAGGSGVGLCVRVHHNVVDASGFSHLLRIWASYCGKPSSSISAAKEDRLFRLLEALNGDLQAASQQSTNELFQKHPEFSKLPPQIPKEFPAATSQIFRISAARLSAIKTTFNNAGRGTPSTNTLLCALMWRAITKSRLHRNPSLEVGASSLVTAVNGRGRVDPGFCSRETFYLGNVVLYSLAKASVTTLASGIVSAESIDQLAAICNLIDQVQSATHIDRRFIAEIFALKNCLEDKVGIFPGWDLFNSKDSTITSWRDLDLYSLQFGAELGCPSFVRPPHVVADGVGFILPRRQCAGVAESHLEVMVALRTDDLNTLSADEEWRSLLEAW